MVYYRKGSATEGIAPGPRVVAHVCNDIGKWGAGFTAAITKAWPEAEGRYRRWYKTGRNFRLGMADIVHVTDDVSVANMIAQKGVRGHGNSVPLRYDALEDCLKTVALYALARGASVHMPRIGCGLAGGTWAQVGPIVERTLSKVDVYVYDL